MEVFGPDNRIVAKGLVAMSASQTRQSVGRHTSEAGGVVIHRDQMVVLVGQ